MMKTGVAIIPADIELRNIIALQREAQALVPMRPILGEVSYVPHLTLLQGTADGPLCTRDLLADVAGRIASVTSDASAAFDSLEYIEKGWYFINVQRELWVRTAHDVVFSACKDQMIVTREAREKDLEGYTPKQVENFLRYGYRYLGDEFHPHVTLGRTVDKQRSPRSDELDALVTGFLSGSHFHASMLTVYEIGEDGGHKNSIYEYNIN